MTAMTILQRLWFPSPISCLLFAVGQNQLTVKLGWTCQVVWLLRFNAEKCKFMCSAHRTPASHYLQWGSYYRQL